MASMRDEQLEELDAVAAIYPETFQPAPENATAAAHEPLRATAQAELSLPEGGLTLEVRRQAWLPKQPC